MYETNQELMNSHKAKSSRKNCLYNFTFVIHSSDLSPGNCHLFMLYISVKKQNGRGPIEINIVLFHF